MENYLVIVEKYERAYNYLYDLARNIPREHMVMRDEVLGILIGGVEKLYVAVMANTKSRVNEFDATLAVLRFFLRQLVMRRMMTPNQATHAEAMLGEVGGMVNSWKQRLK